jgi:hypothetical protein
VFHAYPAKSEAKSHSVSQSGDADAWRGTESNLSGIAGRDDEGGKGTPS